MAAGGWSRETVAGAEKRREWNVWVDAKESVLLFESSGRDEGLSEAGDLYESHRTGAAWGPPLHLPPPINSRASELCPRLSPDGRYLFFSSNRRGSLDVWQIDAPR